MKPSEVAKLLNCAPSTIRNHSAEFADFLSTASNRQAGEHRTYDDLDVRVLSYIRTRLDAGVHKDQIAEELRRLQAREWQGLPMADQPLSGAVAMVPAPTAEAELRMVKFERQLVEQQLAVAQEQIGILEQRLDEAREQTMRDREQLLRELGDLKRALGILEGELNLYRSMVRLKPEARE